MSLGEADWRSRKRIGLWAERSPVRSPSGASSVVALSKSHFHSSMYIVYICSSIVAIKSSTELS